MSELYIGLIALGLVFVIGVYVYNKWQERRYRKLAEKVLSSQHADVLFDDEQESPVSLKQEKTVDFSGNPAKQEPSAYSQYGADKDMGGERIEPVASFDDDLQTDDEYGIETPVPAAAPGIADTMPESPADNSSEIKETSEPDAFLSEQTDYIASFEFIEPIRATYLLQSVRKVLSRLHKPVLWVGYNEATRQWEKLLDSGVSVYHAIRAGLQLVDRQGALQESDLSAFHLLMQDLASQLTAVVNMPLKQPALDAAVRLDEFCAGVDIQIGINVISQGVAFPGTKIRSLAEAAGMVIDNQGRLTKNDEEGNMLFAVLNREVAGFSAEGMKTMTTHGVTFLLDVPKVARGERVFDQMITLATRFAEVLRGIIVDDNRHPLTQTTLEPIRKQIGYYQAMMQERGLPAGKATTIRLFS